LAIRPFGHIDNDIYPCLRLMLNSQVSAALVDGARYQFLLKYGTGGQTGRGYSAIKGKTVNDDKT
jgi:hypothetical protein